MSPPLAMGLMEALWHVTAQHAPRGDIGKLCDQDISDEMFHGGDAGELIRAFVKARLVDEDPMHRLLVHNWSKHADTYVHAQLAKRTLFFADGSRPKIPHEAFDGRTRTRIQSQYGGRTPGELPDVSAKLPAIPEPVPVPLIPLCVPPKGKCKKETTTKRFVKPTPEEVRAYFEEKGVAGAGKQSQKFWDYHESKGWVVGRAPMKDWKAAARTWASNALEFSAHQAKTTTATNGERKRPMAGVDFVYRDVGGIVRSFDKATGELFDNRAWFEARNLPFDDLGTTTVNS